MTLPSPSYTGGGAQWESERLLGLLADVASAYERKLERFEVDLEIIRDQDAIEKYAHAEAHSKVSELAFDFLKAAIMEATADNGEFNIPIFTLHMENALAEHGTELIKVIPDENRPGYVDTKINMLLLGSPELWIKAATDARGKLDLDKVTDTKVRSKIWREIYQIDREAGVKIHPTTDEDVTERYVGKYFATIAERMTRIPPDKAPWWHFINYGNKLVVGGAGTPYPENGPTNFISKTEASITYAFQDLYDSIIREAQRVYTKYLQEDYNISGVTNTFKQLENNMAESIGDAIRDFRSETYKAVGEAETHEAVSTVFYNNAWYDVIKTSGGNTGLRYNLQKNL